MSHNDPITNIDTDDVSVKSEFGHLRVLVACEFSGRTRDAFRALGHDAISCDIRPSIEPGPHLLMDAREAFELGPWDIVIAHPPCTYLAKVGVHWLRRRPERIEQVREAAVFFNACLSAPARHVAVENPIPHGEATALIGRPTQYVQPYEFGDEHSKRTGLWLRGLPPLMAEQDAVPGREALTWTQTRRNVDARQMTPLGLASAMARQWSEFCELDVRTPPEGRTDG